MAEARKLGESGRLAMALDGYAEVVLANGRPAEAGDALREAVQLYEKDGNQRGVVLAKSTSRNCRIVRWWKPLPASPMP